MARLIDAEKAYELGHRTPFHMGIADLCDLKELLADVPTVDAVEVVRCRECKHKGWVQEPCHGKSIDYCKLWECVLDNLDTTFCSYGERKDGDGNG